LYPLDGGRLEVFGESPDERPDLFERSIAYVPQFAWLFSGTIRENIELGAGKPLSEEEFEQAAALAGVRTMVEGMAEGYDSQVGENGTFLSGGQRQRVALARALVRDAPILILDEVTSALDRESQQFIHRSLEQLRKTGKTILLITHNMALAAKADRILVLDNGAVAEDGTHETLLAQNGLYARLYQAYQDGEAP
jgi:ATP-binding cassette subfamily B protein/subfamily B ATP-binding cassette protein MsbA